MKIIAILLALVCSSAFSKCLTNDSFRGHDKTIHFAAGAGIALGVTAHTQDPWKGFYWGAGVGVAKELLDSSGAGTCSLQDMLVTVAGAGIGAYTGSLFIVPQQGGLKVVYYKEF